MKCIAAYPKCQASTFANINPGQPDEKLPLPGPEKVAPPARCSQLQIFAHNSLAAPLATANCRAAPSGPSVTSKSEEGASHITTLDRSGDAEIAWT